MLFFFEKNKHQKSVVLDYAWIGEPMNHTRKTPSITTHENKDWDPQRGRKAKQRNKKKNSSQFRGSWDGRIPTSEVFFCLWHFSLEVFLASCLKNMANQWAMVAHHSNYHWGGESQSFPTNSDKFDKCVLIRKKEILASCRQVSSILESIDQKAPLSEFCQKLQWRLPEGSLPAAKVAIKKTSKKHLTLVWKSWGD